MNIIIWIIIWYSAFAGYYLFFKKRNILYQNNPRLIMGWYTLMSGIGIAVFHNHLGQIFGGANEPWIIGGGLFVVGVSFFWYKALTMRDYVSKEVSQSIFLSKTSEIVFQQIMVWLLFGILQGVFLIVNPIILFTVVFFIIHIPLIAVISWKKGLLFTLASFLGGIIFALCLTFIPSGWLFALAAHVFFYACVASKKKIFGMDSFYVM